VLRLRPRRVRLDGVALCDLWGLHVLLQLGYAQQKPRGCLRWTARLLRWLGGRACPGGGDLVAGLRVTVRPEGSAGPERVRRVECAVLGEEAIDPRRGVLGGLGPRDLDPVPRRAACAQVYGGPGTARVTGELRGVHVSAEFDSSDACEVARWRRNVALLGAPGVGHAVP
jgi:hypothetical protein